MVESLGCTRVVSAGVKIVDPRTNDLRKTEFSAETVTEIADEIDAILDKAITAKNLTLGKLKMEQVHQQQYEHYKIYSKLKNIPSTKNGLFRQVVKLREELSNFKEANKQTEKSKDDIIRTIKNENRALVASKAKWEATIGELKARVIQLENEVDEEKYSNSHEITNLKQSLNGDKQKHIERIRILEETITSLKLEHRKEQETLTKENKDLHKALEEEKTKYIGSKLRLLERDYEIE